MTPFDPFEAMWKGVRLVIGVVVIWACVVIADNVPRMASSLYSIKLSLEHLPR